ncbi:jg16824 [Pararge aegeria aegeria]|uniref:Jg16824 protein n=1 Tax=Pararge aegeria aegeria TaxID=348720 RepID=A0A8S4SKH5_9NEOP|nr:jg16824 [Pararge aegeria aegeria]
MPTSPARGAPCRLTDEALATDKWRYIDFKLARLNKWHRPVSGSSDAGAISLDDPAMTNPPAQRGHYRANLCMNGEKKATAPSPRQPRYSWLWQRLW